MVSLDAYTAEDNLWHTLVVIKKVLTVEYSKCMLVADIFKRTPPTKRTEIDSNIRWNYYHIVL